MRVRVPANVDMPDRILAGLTLRQLVVLIVDGLLIWIIVSTLQSVVPLPVVVLAVLPLVAVGAVFVIQTTPGMGLDRLVLLALRFLTGPKRLVLAPEGMPEPTKSGLGVVDLPLESVDDEGVVDLGSEGRALVGRAGTLNLSLRAEREQEAIIDGFGRFLNSLEAPVHFLVRAEPVDLTGVIADIEAGAKTLHPALAAPARAHAAFLRSLSGAGDSLRREVFVCIRVTAAEESATTKLTHQMAEAESQLRSVGVRLSRLGGDETRTLLRRCASPDVSIPFGANLSDDLVAGRTR